MAIDKAVDSGVLDGYFTDIADAIRGKNGSSGTYTPTQMATAISALPSAPVLITKSITDNGTYNASSDSADGYSQVVVNVSGGGGGDTVPASLLDGTITSVTIPNSITSLRPYCFHNCSSLETVIAPTVRSLYNYAFNNCGSLKNVTLSSNLGVVGQYAFCNCTSLESIDLGSDLETLNNYAFSGCTSLMNITIRKNSKVVTTSGNTFRNVPANCNIYVPADMVNAYKQSSYWSARADYIQAIS